MDDLPLHSRKPKGGNMNTNLKKFLFIILLVPILLGAQNNKKPPEVGIEEHLGKIIPLDLTFKDSNGLPVKLKDLIKKPTVLSMVYYHCTMICMPLLGSETDVLDSIDLVPGKDYNALTISFNDRETPDHAKNIKDNFIKRFSKPFPEDSWHFLTGDTETIKKLTDSLGFYFKRDGDGFVHPTALIMLSPQGKITRYFYGVSYLPFDIKMGLVEASEGKTGPAISRVLLYCFRFDPDGKKYVFNILKVTGTITLFFLAIFVLWLVIAIRKKKPAHTAPESTNTTEPGKKENIS
jgi:protein SCO1